jgi:hypothetical protein
VVVVDHLLEGADDHRRPAELFELLELLLLRLLAAREAIAILDKFLLEEQPVLHALQLEQAKLALRVRGDRRKLGSPGRSMERRDLRSRALFLAGGWLRILLLAPMMNFLTGGIAENWDGIHEVVEQRSYVI